MGEDGGYACGADDGLCVLLCGGCVDGADAEIGCAGLTGFEGFLFGGGCYADDFVRTEKLFCLFELYAK